MGLNMAGGRDRWLAPRDTILALLVVISLCAGPGIAAGGSSSGPVSNGLAGPVNADSVVMYVSLQPDGTADWRVEYRIRLETTNDTAAFEAMREDIQANGSDYRERFAEGIRRTVADAENATGREMAARDFAVGTETRQLPNEYGIVYYTFEWTNFAATDEETVRAGDSLAGLFLDDETTLQMEWPEDYQLQTAAPEPTVRRSQAVSWTGSLNFASGEPLVVVARTATDAPGGDSTTRPGTTGGGADGANGSSVPPWLLVIGVVLSAVPIAVWYARRRSEQVTRTTQPAVPTNEPDRSEQPEDRSIEESERDDASETDDGPPEELLSNEERVLKLLDEHGGRIKQQAVVEGLGWTDAKTSQVVGKLREDGEIEVFRLGRENVLTLPDEEL